MNFPKRGNQEQPPQAAPVTAEQIQKTVQAAKALESIPGQELLEDPALNPATRAKYDELTAARLQAELDLVHRRKLRDAQEADRREGEQAEVDRIIAAARRATSPARRILDMTRHQARFGRLSLAASLALSVGSAIGLAALVANHGGPAPVGYLAEIGLTGLSTTVIIWRGILARAGAAIEPGTQQLFAVLVVLPLLVSIAGSTLGSGPVGAACSVGSALFAGLAYLINTSAAAAIGQSIREIDHHDSQQAAPERPSEHPARTEPSRASTQPRRGAGDGLEEVGEVIAEGAADWLRSHGNPSERSHETDRSHGGNDTASDETNDEVKASERERSDENSPGPGRPLTAQERRRLEGLKNRRRVEEVLYKRPDAKNSEIAEQLKLGESMVRRIRREIDGESST